MEGITVHSASTDQTAPAAIGACGARAVSTIHDPTTSTHHLS
jgi:hypothetical protein